MNTQPDPERTVTLTVYAIEAQQLDVTTYGEPRSRYMNVRIKVRAHGYGIDFAWQPTDPTERWWPGDTVQVTLPERKADA